MNIIIDEKLNVRLISHSSRSETMGGTTIKHEQKAVTNRLDVTNKESIRNFVKKDMALQNAQQRAAEHQYA